MTAEEFRKTWRPKSTDEDYVNSFAEAYKNHCVEDILDKEIKFLELKRHTWDHLNIEDYSRLNTLIEFKRQLLKQ